MIYYALLCYAMCAVLCMLCYAMLPCIGLPLFPVRDLSLSPFPLVRLGSFGMKDFPIQGNQKLRFRIHSIFLLTTFYSLGEALESLFGVWFLLTRSL